MKPLMKQDHFGSQRNDGRCPFYFEAVNNFDIVDVRDNEREREKEKQTLMIQGLLMRFGLGYV
jgi:hypothetical protein